MLRLMGEIIMKLTTFAVLLLSACLAGQASAQNTSYPKDVRPAHAPMERPPADPRIAELEMALKQVDHERQAVYQQFQMTQELRRNEIQDNNPQVIQGANMTSIMPYASGGLSGNPPVSYDDQVRLLRERQERIQQYGQDLNRLYSRYTELGEQRRALFDQLMELTRSGAGGQ
jgi:predicted secreted protein